MQDTPISVLIVDDDHWVTRAITSVLSAAPGIHVSGTAHSGEQAVTAYAAEPTDVVLMDINMPGITGVEATAAIIRDAPDARVLILSTIAPGPGLARAIDAGALAAVHKNAAESTLVTAIQAAVHGDDPELLRGLAGDLLLSGDAQPGAPVVAPRLTEAEYATLRLICEGLGYAEIAARRGSTRSTVTTQARTLREKLGANSLAQLVVRAVQFRFIGT